MRTIPLGFKIVGLATLLLSVMAAVSVYSYFRIIRVKNETVDLTEHWVPLTHALARLDSVMLQQEVHRERLLEFSGMKRDEVRMNEELKRFSELTKVVDQEIGKSRRLVADSLKRAQIETDRIEMARLEPMLVYIGRSHQKLGDDFLRAFGRHTKGQVAEAGALLEVVRDSEERLAGEMGAVHQEVDRFTENFSKQVEGHELGVARLAGENLAVTLVAGLVGLVLGGVITAGLVRPVRKLMNGALAVEHGDLDVQVAVTTRDEIGQLAQSFNSMVHELKVKQRIKEVFGKYVDPRIVETLIRDTGIPAIGGERQVMTILFCDMVGFTSISELLTPDVLVRMVNRYLTLMSEPVLKQRGVIDKYIGDAVMAFWGPPLHAPDEHGLLACRAALEQLRSIDRLRRELPELLGIKKGLPKIGMRVGVSTGLSVVGNIGSDVSTSYTVMGEPVNIASRLEGANKQYGTHILISEETEQMAAAEFLLREIDFVRVVGKSDPLRIFELLGEKEAADSVVLELVEQFSAGLRAYRELRWDDADRVFARCLELRPGDGPSLLFLQRLNQLRLNPPPADWEGVWTMAQK